VRVQTGRWSELFGHGIDLRAEGVWLKQEAFQLLVPGTNPLDRWLARQRVVRFISAWGFRPAKKADTAKRATLATG
jgi:hypothetical protein